jgi:hypothetical protein
MTPSFIEEPRSGIDRAVRLGLLVLLSALIGALLVLGFWLEGPVARGSERASPVLTDRTSE